MSSSSHSIWRGAFFICCLQYNAFAQSLVEPVSKDNSTECDCYVVSGPDPGYFQYHRFWDFRHVPSDDDDEYTVAPDLITNAEDEGIEPVTSSYFNTSDFLRDWSIQTGGSNTDSPVPKYYSARNIYLSRNTTNGASNSTYLTLRTSRLQSFMSVAEMDSTQTNLYHSSIRARIRVIPNGLSNTSAPSSGSRPVDNSRAGSNASHPVDDGAVFGFFTYRNDKEESDTEILTHDPVTQIHYSNQPDWNDITDVSIPGASTQVTVPDWTEWAVHRIDWYYYTSRWYVNDRSLLNKTMNVPAEPSGLILNLWGDGDTWSGNMSVGGQVTVAIEWIEMVFNITGDIGDSVKRKRDKDYCNAACKIDDVETVGVPEKTSTGASFSRPSTGVTGLAFGLAFFVMAFSL